MSPTRQPSIAVACRPRRAGGRSGVSRRFVAPEKIDEIRTCEIRFGRASYTAAQPCRSRSRSEGGSRRSVATASPETPRSSAQRPATVHARCPVTDIIHIGRKDARCSAASRHVMSPHSSHSKWASGDGVCRERYRSGRWYSVSLGVPDLSPPPGGEGTRAQDDMGFFVHTSPAGDR
jgi:hypothetical protein